MDVLVYVDPSPRGEWALAVAAQLPPSWTASVHLLATQEDVEAEPGLLARARARLPAAASDRAVRGPAERAVVEEAGARRYSLVIVPPAGRGALARMLKGSRVATVVRSVQAPVLVARRPAARLDRVLAALSGGETTGPVLEAALLWERGTGASSSFVHVRAEVALPFAAAEAKADTPAPGEAELLAVRAALRRGEREGALIVREGLVVEEVLDEFEAGAYQLLVIGSRGDEGTGFGREDVTERLLLRCPGPTLIVPR